MSTVLFLLCYNNLKVLFLFQCENAESNSISIAMALNYIKRYKHIPSNSCVTIVLSPHFD